MLGIITLLDLHLFVPLFNKWKSLFKKCVLPLRPLHLHTYPLMALVAMLFWECILPSL